MEFSKVFARNFFLVSFWKKSSKLEIYMNVTCLTCKQHQAVRMAEWSKAPDSSETTCPAFQEHKSILVHVCGRGFKSHS